MHGGCQGELPKRDMKVQDHDKQAWGGGKTSAWGSLRSSLSDTKKEGRSP